jgi:hypothetical protein
MGWIEGSYTLFLNAGAGIDMTTVVHHTLCRRFEIDSCSSVMIAYGIEPRRAAVLVVF